MLSPAAPGAAPDTPSGSEARSIASPPFPAVGWGWFWGVPTVPAVEVLRRTRAMRGWGWRGARASPSPGGTGSPSTRPPPRSNRWDLPKREPARGRRARGAGGSPLTSQGSRPAAEPQQQQQRRLQALGAAAPRSPSAHAVPATPAARERDANLLRSLRSPAQAGGFALFCCCFFFPPSSSSPCSRGEPRAGRAPLRRLAPLRAPAADCRAAARARIPNEPPLPRSQLGRARGGLWRR